MELTLADFARQFVLQLLETLGGWADLGLTASSLDSGGLRGGWVQFAKGTLRFHGYSYVPGVSISGTLKAASVTLRVGGSAAARGTLRLGPHKALVGELGGQRVHLNRGTPRRVPLLSEPMRVRAPLSVFVALLSALLARRLAGLLSSLPWN